VLAGAAKIIAVDVVPAKLELARRLGATHAIDAAKRRPVAAIRDLTRGGATTPSRRSATSRSSARRSTRLARGGALTIAAVPKDSARGSTSWSTPSTRNKAILGCRYGTAPPRRDFAMLADLYLGAGSRSTSSSRAATPLDEFAAGSTICAPGGSRAASSPSEVAPWVSSALRDRRRRPRWRAADWQERLPREFQPHMAARREGISRQFANLRASASRRRRGTARVDSLSRPGMTDPRSRLEDMDLEAST